MGIYADPNQNLSARYYISMYEQSSLRHGVVGILSRAERVAQPLVQRSEPLLERRHRRQCRDCQQGVACDRQPASTALQQWVSREAEKNRTYFVE
jgi:hypothetical protein